mmetsp:Transcript_14790/g.34441  ORF Transcript_14790/g.34441 Transcript_14790/m.34441 type:complete len:91 (-) Transcript_14790:32-304(-)
MEFGADTVTPEKSATKPTAAELGGGAGGEVEGANDGFSEDAKPGSEGPSTCRPDQRAWGEMSASTDGVFSASSSDAAPPPDGSTLSAALI